MKQQSLMHNVALPCSCFVIWYLFYPTYTSGKSARFCFILQSLNNKHPLPGSAGFPASLLELPQTPACWRTHKVGPSLQRGNNEALSSGEPKHIFSNVARGRKARGQNWKILAEDHHSIKPQ